MITANKTDIFSAKWTNIVFEGRNKDYGAYELRKLYERNVVLGIFFTLLLFVAVVSTPVLINYMKSDVISKNIPVPDDPMILQKIPPVILPSEPFIIPPPPVKAALVITVPVVKPAEYSDSDYPLPDDPIVDKGNTTTDGVATTNAVNVPSFGDSPTESVSDAPLTSVEEWPQFPGGERERIRFIQQNTLYPPLAKENNIQGIVYVQFVVNKEGEMTNMKILHGIGAGCDEEALRVLKLMPRWKPGKNNGHPVSVQYNMPFKFTLK